MSPEDRALRQTVEALAFEGILTPAHGGWTLGGLTIRAPHRLQATGRPRLVGRPCDAAGRPLRIATLARALAETGHDPAPLVTAVRRSAHFLRAAGPVRPDRLSLTGLALEAALIEGHPYHPGFKARVGFDDADNRAFGPEAGQPIRPVWLRVDPGLLRRAGTDVAQGWAPAGAVPVHPWQWRDLCRDARMQAVIASGRIAPLAVDGPAMQATASLRTLAARDGGDHLKLSLGVGVTSSVRDLVPWSVAVAPAISDWLAGVVAGDPALAGLRILREHGAVIVAEDLLAGRLAAIRRSPPPDAAVPLSALSLSDPDGQALIAPWLARHGTRAWVTQFLAVLRPVWRLMTRHGIALEAHGQNLLITHDDGWPTGLIARDFSESLEYVDACLSGPPPDLTAVDPRLADAPPGSRHAMPHPTDLRDLVTDCLVVHVLSDLANLLHDRGHLPEPAFWQLCRAAWPPAPHLATDAATLPAESLALRLLGGSGSHNVPNPLKDPEMTHHFRLNDRLVDPMSEDWPDLLVGRDPERTRIALLLGDRAASLAQILRLRAAGASCHPIHPETPQDQARALALRAGCDLWLTDAGLEDLGQAAPHAPGGVLIQTSSGTTGAPKIIARSWAAIQTEIDAYIRAFPQADGMVPVIAAPVTHSYGLIAGVLVGQARGRVPVVLDHANPRAILRQLEGVAEPLLYAAPPLLHVLARLAGPGGLKAAVMSSGTVLPQPWFDAIRGAATRMFQQYGCSEAGCLAIAPDPSCPEDMGAPLPHVRLRAGRDTPAAVTVDGSPPIDTGDLGVIDDRGHLIFAGRAAEVIDVAGLNVYPAQIEAAALSLPGITDAVAFAIPDPAAHQRPALAYAGDVPEAVLDAHLTATLSARQRPLRLIRLPALPRGANGKIARRDLAATLLSETAS
ncbi:IucA/IucC family protein [Paracoccus sp. ME4]|uniref:IucA/IucC family protein n=1 Tax=Paracoccus sp. ME4 TaxID=3138066 RepID=UPI00398B731F